MTRARTGPVPAGRLAAGGWFLLAWVVITLLVHIDRMAWIHEEPRRVIVAQEMILTGNYLMPTIYQVPYYKKPPFYNWLIVLASGGQLPVTPRAARTLSVVALLILSGTAAMAMRAQRPAVSGSESEGDRERVYFAALVTLTCYLTMCEYGNMAEPDMVLGALTFLSYVAYLRGRRQTGLLLLSALCMGLGILTKGVSPLFFYPGLLIHALLQRAERRRAALRLATHLGLSLVLPVAWALALRAGGHSEAMLGTAASEISGKALGNVGSWLAHIAVYPVRLWIVLLPWSLVLLAIRRRERSSGWLYETSLWILVSSLLIFTLAARSRDRYMLPAVPFFAIVVAHRIDLARRMPVWPGRVLLWLLAGVCIVAGWTSLEFGLLAGGIGLLATGAVALALSRFRYRVVTYTLAVAAVVLGFYEHGIYAYRAACKWNSDVAAEEVAALLADDRPIVIEPGPDLIHLAVALEGRVARPIYDRRRFSFPEYYLITDERHALPAVHDVVRLRYPRRKVGTLVLQQVPPGAEGLGASSQTDADIRDAMPGRLRHAGHTAGT